MHIILNLLVLVLTIFIFLPFFPEGRRHDAFMLVKSNLLHDLEINAFSPTVEPMFIYGDPAYPLRVHLQCPFRQRNLTPDIKSF